MHEFTNRPVYLGLGEALAAFGLIFAVYQLRKPQWDLVLRIRSSWQRNLFWILGGLGLLLTLVRVLLAEFTVKFLKCPFNDPLYYEIAAYLFFIASPLSLIYFSTRVKNLFDKKTSNKFYNVLVQEISRTNIEGVNAALNVLLQNFRDICKATQQAKEDDETRLTIRSLLDVILSDELVVKILTTKRLDALHLIFGVIEEYSISRRESGIGIPKIVQNLFNDKDSFFYNHLENDGLALSWNIFEKIYDSPVILTNFDLFGYPTFEYSMSEEIDISGINVFIEALSRSIKTYLKTGHVPPEHVNHGLSHLSEIFGKICLKISIEEERGFDIKYTLKDEWWKLHSIAHFLGHDYMFLGHDEKLDEKVAEREKTALKADFYSYSTINEGIACALFKAFEQLSYIENTTETYRLALELLYGIMYESERKKGYQEPFIKGMWNKITENLIDRYYPAVLKTYLQIIAFFAVSDRQNTQGWAEEQAERMKRLLYIDLKPLLDANAEMINGEKMQDALLPKSVDYRDGNFIYTSGYGQGKEVVIPAPPKDSRSALEEPDVRHRSLD